MAKSKFLDEALLSNSLSGFVAGGIPGAWFSGMAFVEGLRVYHDLPENTSVALRLYLTSLILLSLVATVPLSSHYRQLWAWCGLAIHRRSVAFVVALVGIITSLFLSSFSLSIYTARDLFKSNSYYALRNRGSLWSAYGLSNFLSHD
ncbi:hypothetical protein CROQUDRAFT_87588 [Cronartium quercuum f. sp. fusiforme G11]|uniref:Uncharacterized protein n=1 Tax=Cronartium quercuum f. sp. fusiforme G11 TaxID=708437 RepID=A0A9P6NUY0_9BASI|nr:hypothetical protein CROQUDRAFT_87588 [Cronartium quercuum f. sp. fusiforme G11]